MVNVTQVGDVIVVVLYSLLYLFFIYDFFAHSLPTLPFTLYTIHYTLYSLHYTLYTLEV